MTVETKRINVTLPVRLLEEMRRYIPKRERNKFIVEATEQELQRAKLKAVLEDLRREPAWSDEDHPDLMTVDDVNRYVRELRERSMPQTWDEIIAEAESEHE
ncbi:MAG: hypothetical protein KKD28_12065 [Chloroflexi bacterium]|nr:hypothetical protein [Chloroflexota bacterium]